MIQKWDFLIRIDILATALFHTFVREMNLNISSIAILLRRYVFFAIFPIVLT